MIIRKFTQNDVTAVSEVVQNSLKPSLIKISKEFQLQILDRNNPENFLKGRENIEYWVGEELQKVIGIIGLDNNEIRTFYVGPITPR